METKIIVYAFTAALIVAGKKIALNYADGVYTPIIKQIKRDLTDAKNGFSKYVLKK